MAAKTDLSWQEVQDELTAMGYTDAVAVVGGKIMIDVGVITGESVTAMTQEGVVEFLYKFRQGAGLAQTTANESQIEGEQLASFPPFSYGAPSEEGLIEVTQVSAFVIPLDTTSITGPNV